jgi:hypothetical protein
VIKILEWRAYRDVKEAKAFIRVVVYYRIWVVGFAIVAAPIYYLMKKGVVWNWGPEQDRAMESLKTAITQALALVGVFYGDGAGLVILAVDASLNGWGCTLMQLDAKGRRMRVGCGMLLKGITTPQSGSVRLC